VSDEVGVVIAGVLQGSPGEKAGLLPGDVVSAINGQSVPGVAALLAAVAQLTPGQPAQLSVRRHGNTLEITITPSQRPTPAQRLQR